MDDDDFGGTDRFQTSEDRILAPIATGDELLALTWSRRPPASDAMSFWRALVDDEDDSSQAQ